MKTSFFLRSWRRKDKSITPKIDDTLPAIPPYHSYPSVVSLTTEFSPRDCSAIPANATAEGRSLFHNKSVIDLSSDRASHSHTFPRSKSHIKPKAVSTPIIDPAWVASKSVGSSPQRPPRPSNGLYSSAGVPTLTRMNKHINDSTEMSSTFESHDLPRSTSLPHISQTQSMPQLDGVWEGFLKEVSEDIIEDETPMSKHRHVRTVSKQNISGGERRRRLTNASSLADIRETDVQRIDFSVRNRLHSTCPIQQHPSPSFPSLPLSSGDSDSEVDLDIDLSGLFPTPPPLTVRKKVPKPLVLRSTRTITPLPSSPSWISSQDSTPIATPTSPRMNMSPSPASILKKPPGHSAYSQSNRSFDVSPQSTTVLLVPDNDSFVPLLSPSRHRHKSVSPVQSKHQLDSHSHRLTSSDSQAISHRTVNPTVNHFYKTPCGDMTYLKSKGRRCKDHNTPDAPVQWGYAV